MPKKSDGEKLVDIDESAPLGSVGKSVGESHHEHSKSSNWKSLVVASIAESSKAIAASHDQQFGSILSSIGSNLIASSFLSRSDISSKGKAPAPGGAGASKITPTQSKMFLIIFLCLFFIGAALFSVPAPFFPTRALEKGMSQTIAGFVLGSMQLVQFVAAVIFGNFNFNFPFQTNSTFILFKIKAMTMFHFGLKFMLCYGIIWAAVCSVLFGVLDLGPNDASYIVLCFLIRLFQGIGVSAYYISCSTMAAVLFSENYAFTVGILQTCYSLGCLIGPSIGGALYAAGGYITPFVVMGVLLLIFAPIIAIAIPSDVVSSDEAEKSHESPVGVFRVMLCPSLLCLFYTMIVGTMTTVFTETTMGVRLAYFNVTDPLLVGVVYLSSSGAYGITAPIAGRITDKYDAGWAVMFIGTWMSIIGYLVIGPSPMFGSVLPPSLAQMIIGSFIAHSGISW